MKKTFFYILLCIVAFYMGGCESEFVPFHEGIPKGGFVRWDAEVESLNFSLDLTAEDNPIFEAPIVAPSDNVSNYKLSFVLATAAGNFGPFDLLEIRTLPAMLTFSAQDVADAAGVELANLKGRLDFDAEVTRDDGTVFTFNDFTGDLSNPGQRQAMHFSVGLVCPSDLAGTFDFVHTNQVTGPGGGPCTEEPLTGTVTWTEIGPGQYSTSDGTFGLFPNCWADDPVTGITINDSCDLLSTSGSDQYGDSYTYKVISIEGPVMVLSWENTYGDGGTVELTRQDGKDWPQLAS